MASDASQFGRLRPLRSWLEPAAARGAGSSEAPLGLTPRLAELYGGGLNFPDPPGSRPHIFANFVSTLDGVVSFSVTGAEGGGAISHNDLGDRFVMGLLRASADALLVGAGTLAPVPAGSLWLAESVCPEAREMYRDYQPTPPLLVIVSGSGAVNLDRAVFHADTPPGRRCRALILTSLKGRERLKHAGADRLSALHVVALDSGPRGLPTDLMLHRLRTEYGVGRLLHEGGPTLAGEFLRAGVVDELFLTLAPRIAGRDRASAGDAERPRPGLAEGVAFSPATAPEFELISGKQLSHVIYLRYRRG